MRFIFITIDGNHSVALRNAVAALHTEHGIDVSLGLYEAASLRTEADWQRLERDLAQADFVFGARLFGEAYVRPLERLLSVATCPVCIITSNPALIRCTKLGAFSLRAGDEDQSPGLLKQWVRKLRPQGGANEARRQLAVLRNLSKVLKLIPGKARDLYTYIVAHQYWLNNSPENLHRLLCFLIERYIPGYKGKLPILDPLSYPETALFHPAAAEPFADLASYQKWQRKRAGKRTSIGTVGLLTMRTVALSGNTAHLAALVEALEVRGLDVRLAYGSGLDMRPAVEQFFGATEPQTSKPSRKQPSAAQQPVDLLINCSGFSLVGGPAESRPEDARVALEHLDVGYLNMMPLAFQRTEEWQRDSTGLAPIQLALSVALPELDGAAEPLIFGGPSLNSEAFVALPDQIELAANRIVRRVAMRRAANADKKISVVLFNFPPTLGNIGSAAYLDVFASLYALLGRLQSEGYAVDLPASVEVLRDSIIKGNTALHGTDANVAAQFPVSDYRRLFAAEAAIEPFWGKAPGELLNNGKNFLILGQQFGNVFVGVQPSFGYERDPMRLLMAKDATPNHAFAAFYTWLNHVFAADAVIHFGTHGALEFMPGKQAGMSSDCWPTRLLGDLPNFYLYSVNNPSEATIAKRRGAATMVSYLVPPLQQAGLYKGLRQLKDALDQYRQHPDAGLLDDIRLRATQLSIGVDVADDSDDYIAVLTHELIQVEQRMIPTGLHVLGQAPEPVALVDFLALAATFHAPTAGKHRGAPARPLPHLVAEGLGWDYAVIRDAVAHSSTAQDRWQQIDAVVHEAMRQFVAQQQGAAPSVDDYLHTAANIAPGTLAPLWAFLGELLYNLTHDGEIEGLLHGLHGGFIAPSPSNDVVRNPAVVPTGRNVHSLDPSRVPSPVAQANAEKLMGELLERLTVEQGALPETVAVVLWGTDNLKSDCEGVAQVLALMGLRPVIDELGNVSDVALVPLAELGRPRVDVVATVSGIFRDLLSNQMHLIDKAARLAATADEPTEQNFVRKHTLVQAAELGIPLAEAATRVFANAPGSYGANVNHLVESSTWDDSEQLSEAFLSRKSFTMNAQGEWGEARPLMERVLTTVDASFQNIDSFEVGVSDIDNYYESLGGLTHSVASLRDGKRPAVMVADAVATTGRLSSLEQMVRLETRAKLLNPKWYEAMLEHGYEGAREIEARVNNTYGWSATTDSVDGWVYNGIADTFILDEAMRDRLTQLNPHAAAGMVRRLLEANSRGFWDADDSMLDALHDIYEDLEDRLEGVFETAGD